MENDHLLLGETAQNFHHCFRAMTDLDISPSGPPAFDDESAPALLLAKDSTQRVLQDVFTRPDYDLRLYPVAVPERSRRIHKIRNDVDALLFDAQGGHFGEACRLDSPHARTKRMISTPTFDPYRRAR